MCNGNLPEFLFPLKDTKGKGKQLMIKKIPLPY